MSPQSYRHGSPAISRREFLRLVGILAAASAIPGRALASPKGNVDRVIVVGAGVSGLTAARLLSLCGTDVVVVEARDRIGGRTHTADLAGVPVDMGAAWVHGAEQDNPVARVLSAAGIATAPDNPDASIYEAGAGYLSNQTTNQLFTRYENFHENLRGLRRVTGRSGSVADGITAYLDELALSGNQRDRTDFLIRALAEDGYAGAAEDMSFRSYWEDEDFAGGCAFPAGGYVGMIDYLAAGLTVDLNTPVSGIDYTGRGVTVTTASGTYQGSHCIVTVPLGVLKSGSITFTPELPRSTQAAINVMDMGHLEKVILRFSSAFWGNFQEVFYKSALRGEYPYFKDVSAYAGAPTIIAFPTANFGAQVASADPAAVVARVLEILGDLTGQTPPVPLASHVTNWSTDPYAMGSYSYIPVGAGRREQKRLARPLRGRVRFAGEATSPDYYGNVHGAMLSGIREASKLLRGRQDVEDLIV